MCLSASVCSEHGPRMVENERRGTQTNGERAVWRILSIMESPISLGRIYIFTFHKLCAMMYSWNIFRRLKGRSGKELLNDVQDLRHQKLISEMTQLPHQGSRSYPILLVGRYLSTMGRFNDHQQPTSGFKLSERVKLLS